jgi:hypothetical protein
MIDKIPTSANLDSMLLRGLSGSALKPEMQEHDAELAQREEASGLQALDAGLSIQASAPTLDEGEQILNVDAWGDGKSRSLGSFSLNTASASNLAQLLDLHAESIGSALLQAH